MTTKLVHFELPAEDTARARAFWSAVAGWQFGDSAMPDFEYYMVQTGEDQGRRDLTPRTPGRRG
jgi:predicted enzyme related to lactoylglutathione lyase